MRRGICAAVVALSLAPQASAWTWPVDGAVLRPFSTAASPYEGGQHRGIDIAAAAGSAVLAPAAGEISFAGTVPRGGKTLTIRTDDGFSVTLLHLGALAAGRGERVQEGQPVAASGPSGEVEHDVAYVHLGVRRTAEADGYVDPLGLLPAIPAPAATEAAAARPPANELPPAPASAPAIADAAPAAAPPPPALPAAPPGEPPLPAPEAVESADVEQAAVPSSRRLATDRRVPARGRLRGVVGAAPPTVESGDRASTRPRRAGQPAVVPVAPGAPHRSADARASGERRPSGGAAGPETGVTVGVGPAAGALPRGSASPRRTEPAAAVRLTAALPGARSPAPGWLFVAALSAAALLALGRVLRRTASRRASGGGATDGVLAATGRKGCPIGRTVRGRRGSCPSLGLRGRRAHCCAPVVPADVRPSRPRRGRRRVFA